MLEGIVPDELVRRAADVVWRGRGAEPADPATWYGSPSPFVAVGGRQALWDIRQHPDLHAAFAGVLGTDALWATLDRAGFKPPAHPDHPGSGTPLAIHFDRDPRDDGTWLQGLVALSDVTGDDQGGFMCVPSIFEDLGDWLASHPDTGLGVPPSDAPIEQVRMRGGDLLIFDSRLPHGNAWNRSERPRLAFYVTMFPAPEDPATREARLAEWRADPAELTPLGRKLLGADAW